MSEAKATARPLNAKLCKAPDDGLPYYCIETPLGQIVARCNTNWGAYFLEAVNHYDTLLTRNKRLTEALEKLKEIYGERLGGGMACDHFEQWQDAHAIARAALAEDKEQTDD